MKQIILMMCMLVAFSGCQRISPRFKPKIDNENGKIDEIKNNQNGIMGEIGTLKNQAEIQNSKLNEVQQGVTNLQANNENSGIQILSGSGGMAVGAMLIICSTIIILHYRNQAILSEKTANILTERIVNMKNPELEDAVFQAAMYTNVEEKVLNLVNKHKAKVKD